MEMTKRNAIIFLGFILVGLVLLFNYEAKDCVNSVLTVSIFFIIGLILYLFYKVEKEKEFFKKLSVTDDLTGLYNRRKFQEDVKKSENSVLLIVNIDKFKYYNKTYGVEVSDFILKDVAQTLEILLSTIDATIYKLGSDDFGILAKKGKINVEKLSRAIVNYFADNILEINNLEINISVNIGISDVEPLIETAYIALKEVNKNLDKGYAIYKPEMNSKKITNKFDIIKYDNSIPHFRPIFDDKTGEIIEYELL
jgi:diguanylate cyclase (GGDEF)-like protein